LGIPPKKKNTILLGLQIKKSNKKMENNPWILGIPPKKKNTVFWVSRLRRAIRKWLQPLDFGYTSKKRRTFILGNRMQKNDKILENWKPLG
jgi:hypothetical protein